MATSPGLVEDDEISVSSRIPQSNKIKPKLEFSEPIIKEESTNQSLESAIVSGNIDGARERLREEKII